MIIQVTQQMQIPLSYADAVIGTAGASISYIRRSSGATVTIQETRGVPGEMTVEISGTASQVQTAQQLIQAMFLVLNLNGFYSICFSVKLFSKKTLNWIFCFLCLLVAYFGFPVYHIACEFSLCSASTTYPS